MFITFLQFVQWFYGASFLFVFYSSVLQWHSLRQSRQTRAGNSCWLFLRHFHLAYFRCVYYCDGPPQRREITFVISSNDSLFLLFQKSMHCFATLCVNLHNKTNTHEINGRLMPVSYTACLSEFAPSFISAPGGACLRGVTPWRDVMASFEAFTQCAGGLLPLVTSRLNSCVSHGWICNFWRLRVSSPFLKWIFFWIALSVTSLPSYANCCHQRHDSDAMSLGVGQMSSLGRCLIHTLRVVVIVVS